MIRTRVPSGVRWKMLDPGIGSRINGIAMCQTTAERRADPFARNPEPPA